MDFYRSNCRYFNWFSCALFLKSLELATNLRIEHSWLLFLLPFGGAFVSFLYSKYGKNSSKGNNLIIDKINENSGKVPLRMAPLVFFGTFITHLIWWFCWKRGYRCTNWFKYSRRNWTFI